MAEQGAEQPRIPGQAPCAPARGAHQRGEVGGRVVRERIAFGVPPDEFDRVQLGGVRREQLRPHGRMSGEPAGDHLAPVRVAPVPDQRQGRAHHAPQLAEEGPPADGIDAGVGREAEVTRNAIPARRDHQRRDHGDLLARPAPLTQDRGLSARRPGAAHQRGDQDARFVNEDERGPAARGVFFTCGQRTLTHRAIAASSRSMARRAGCCGLHPNVRKIRLTCETW